MTINPIIYERKIEEANKVLKATLIPETPREKALVVQIEKAREALRG